jgi:hypothetical protein
MPALIFAENVATFSCRPQRAHELLLGPEEVNFSTHFRQESGPHYVQATGGTAAAF